VVVRLEPRPAALEQRRGPVQAQALLVVRPEQHRPQVRALVLAALPVLLAPSRELQRCRVAEHQGQEVCGEEVASWWKPQPSGLLRASPRAFPRRLARDEGLHGRPCVERGPRVLPP